MTKDEAIKKLEETVGAYLLSGRADDTTCGEWREILETLKKDNTCEDAISRKAVLHIANTLVGNWHSSDKTLNMTALLRKQIIELSSVTPTREHGRWVVSKINGQYQCYECSCFSGLTEEDVKEGWTLPNFCPNCGAKMEGPKC